MTNEERCTRCLIAYEQLNKVFNDMCYVGSISNDDIVKLDEILIRLIEFVNEKQYRDEKTIRNRCQ